MTGLDETALAGVSKHFRRPTGPDLFSTLAVLPLAALVAITSLAGILLPSTYAGETAEWAAEAVAQDWVNLVLLVPALLVGAALVWRGRRLGAVLLTGALLFSSYSFAIYSFDIHFNRFFLVYCAALGLSVFAGGRRLLDEAAVSVGPEQSHGFAARVVGWFLALVALLFAVLWLATVIPATIAGTVPEAVVAAGLPTNPVHVLDLSLLLPAQFVVGVSLLRGRVLGRRLAPAFLAFGAFMAANLAAIVFSGPAGPALPIGFAVFGVVQVAILVALLRAPFVN